MLHLQLRTRILVLSLVLSLAGSAVGAEAATGTALSAIIVLLSYMIVLYVLVTQIRQIPERDG